VKKIERSQKQNKARMKLVAVAAAAVVPKKKRKKPKKSIKFTAPKRPKVKRI